VELVCCLLAILELCRMRRIRAHQHQNFGDIRIVPRGPEEEQPAYVAVEA
jgi:chromatin segregation and condensation protein Rec8/ScpA/Scc1 (kleisin family)